MEQRRVIYSAVPEYISGEQTAFISCENSASLYCREGGKTMYFCKNCGEPYMSDEAVMCVKCGVAKGQGANYCHNCGKPVAPQAAVCLNCGVPNTPPVPVNAKSKMAAGLLGIFLGAFGVHNFYLGYTSKAVTQLILTIVGMVLSCIVIGAFLVMGIWIWGLVEGIMILSGKINVDGNGMPLGD